MGISSPTCETWAVEDKGLFDGSLDRKGKRESKKNQPCQVYEWLRMMEGQNTPFITCLIFPYLASPHLARLACA